MVRLAVFGRLDVAELGLAGQQATALRNQATQHNNITPMWLINNYARGRLS